MSQQQAIRAGLPRKYWAFRNLVSVIQLGIVALIVLGAVIWSVADGNGLRLWEQYSEFSASMSNWANTQMKMPWE